MFKKIELDAPNVGILEKRYIAKAIDEGYVSTIGPFVKKFEERFAKYIGVKKAVSTQNGTSAIHISLYEFGIGKADEVIVPALTFVASVNPILYVGAKPVFVDVDKITWTIDPGEIKKCITKRTKAILPVHFYGNPCNMDEIMFIAKKYNLKVIEDATESLGACYRGKHVGTFGDLGCFSFNGNKIITTGGGGMVVGNDQERLNHIKFLVNQGRDCARGYYHPEVGFNYRMTNLEAAMGLAQLNRLDEFLIQKRKFHKIYKEQLNDIKVIRFQEEYTAAESSYWMNCIILNKDIKIPSLIEKLKKKGIVTRRVFEPVTEFPPYKKFKKNDYKNSYLIYDKGLCLPSSTLNSKEDIHYVCKVLRKLL